MPATIPINNMSHTHTHTHTHTHQLNNIHRRTHLQTSTEMIFKQMGFYLLFEKVFLRDKDTEFQTMGPKTEKDLLPKFSRQKRGTESRVVSREHSVLDG